MVDAKKSKVQSKKKKPNTLNIKTCPCCPDIEYQYIESDDAEERLRRIYDILFTHLFESGAFSLEEKDDSDDQK